MLKATFKNQQEFEVYTKEQKTLVDAKEADLSVSERKKLLYMIDHPKEFIKEEVIVPKGRPIITNIDYLRKPCELVTDFEEVKEIVKELEITLNYYKGKAIGLAANQIGINKAVAVIRKEDTDEKGKKSQFNLNLVNPKITQREDIMIFPESCLSFPKMVVNTDRYWQIELVNYDKNEEKKFWLFNIEAIVVQHEVSHLLGLTLWDFKHKAR